MANELVENLGRDRRQGRVRRQRFPFAAHRLLLMLCPTHEIPDTLVGRAYSRGMIRQKTLSFTSAVEIERHL